LSKLFEANIFMLPKDQGGRHEPIYDNYSPAFNLRATDINGVISLMQEIKFVNPGGQAEVKIELALSMPIEIGLMFSIREEGKTIGAGSVTKIL
jgi:elongation factor Tu